MTINSHITSFAGLPVLAYPSADLPDDVSMVAWRLEDPNYEASGELGKRLASLLEQDWAGQVTTLVIGHWAYDDQAPIDLLVAAADRLTSLRALFLGDMTYEENEISWIQQGDITPLLSAYPGLEELTVRGSDGLSLTPVRHERLRSLTFQSGGLPSHVVHAVGECDLPALSHLELWLGTENYGGDADLDDLAQILLGTRLPSLRYLGLRDSEIADMVAGALAAAPVVARLDTLDLSLGMLSDAGAGALLTGQPLTHLSRLDLHHHFLSEPVMRRLTEELSVAGVDLDLSEGGDPDNTDDRYIAVSE